MFIFYFFDSRDRFRKKETPKKQRKELLESTDV
jgi:hypothetical protein